MCVCVCLCGECACTRECTVCVSACASTRGLQHKFISQLPFTFPFYGMQQHATTHQFQARKPPQCHNPPPPPIHTCMLRTNRLHHSCAREKKKKTRNNKNKTTRQGFSVLHEPVKTQRKRLLCSQKKKRKGLHVTNFLHMFAEAPSLKTHSFFTLIFQGLPYDFKNILSVPKQSHLDVNAKRFLSEK